MAESEATSKSGLTLSYFPVFGRAGFAEILLAYSGTDYEFNSEISKVAHSAGAPAAAMKAAFAVPILQDGPDVVISQTNTIVRYLAQKLDLEAPGTDGFRADTLVGLMNSDIMNGVYQQFFFGKKATEEKDKYFAERAKLFFETMDAYINESGVFFGDGSRFYSAELCLCYLATWMRHGMGAERYQKYFSDPFPRLQALVDKVLGNEAVKKYFSAERPWSSARLYEELA